MGYNLIIIIVLIGISLCVTNGIYAEEWKTFSNNYISLEIPSNWNITENQNNLIASYGADLRIINPDNKYNTFSFKDSNYKTARDISQSDLESASYIRLGDAEKYYNITVLEVPDLFTYNINGYPTSSTILKYHDQGKVDQEFVVDRKEKATIFEYSDTPELFDSIESQKILNRIIASIKFL